MKKNILIISFAILVFSPAFALKVPALDSPVVDKANVLTSREEAYIEEYLYKLQGSTTAQVAILTVPSLNGESLERYSIDVVDEWKLGQAGEDNGVLILLALKEKKVRIEVGYGLEGDLTDAKSGYIIRQVILPEFKKGDYAQGLYNGAAAVSGVILKTSDISAEQLAASRRSQQRQSSSRASIPFNFIIFLVIIIVSSISRLGRHGRRRGSALPWFFLGSMMGSGRHRHDSGFGGSGGGFGSGGFGGFSGGGGGFGGGGASGGW
ncbi:MAG: TPM domain-containing protein [Spirochaetales bacterium]|nr:TPM domain-containing protein [Spirochaetales bacterium]